MSKNNIELSIEEYIANLVNNSSYPAVLKHVMLVFAAAGLYLWFMMFSVLASFKFDETDILLVIFYLIVGALFLILGLSPLYAGKNAELNDIKAKALKVDELAEKLDKMGDLQLLISKVEYFQSQLEKQNQDSKKPKA